MAIVQVGDRISTSKFGKGVVLKRNLRGVIVRLDNFADIEIFVKHEDLNPTPETSSSARSDDDLSNTPQTRTSAHRALEEQGVFHPSSETAPVSQPSGSEIGLEPALRSSVGAEPAYAKSLRSVDALRFGLVPDEAIFLITVKSDLLQNWATGQFSTGSPVVSAVVGQYGTGKSHTMSLVRALAQSKNYVVANVQLDGRKISLHDLQSLSFEILRSVRGVGVDQISPLTDIFGKAVEVRRTLPPTVQSGTDRTVENFNLISGVQKIGQYDQHAESLEALLSGSREKTPAAVKREILTNAPRLRYQGLSAKPIISSKLAERPESFVEALAGLATVCLQAGFSGLVVTIDELEVESQATPAARNSILTTLRTFDHYLSGVSRINPAPLTVIFGSVVDEDDQNYQVVERMASKQHDGMFELEPFSRDDRLELAERIFELYRDAYRIDDPFDQDEFAAVDQSVTESLGTHQSHVRSFIKRYVAALDHRFGPPR